MPPEKFSIGVQYRSEILKSRPTLPSTVRRGSTLERVSKRGVSFIPSCRNRAWGLG